jgi:hypothetical protein
VRLLLGFMNAARVVFARLAAPARPKRKNKGKAKGRGAIRIRAPRNRAEMKRVAKKETRLGRFKDRKRKNEPKRPPDPGGPELI